MRLYNINRNKIKVAYLKIKEFTEGSGNDDINIFSGSIKFYKLCQIYEFLFNQLHILVTVIMFYHYLLIRGNKK